MRSEDASDLQDFLDWLAARGRSAKTYVTYREAVIALATFAAARGMPLLADLRREHIEDFLRGMYARGNKPATVRNRYASLYQFYAWALEADVRTDHPMARIKAPTVPQQVQPDYTPDEVSRLLASIPARTLMDLRDRAVISVLYDCGLRCQELCDIRIADVRECPLDWVILRGGLFYGPGTGLDDDWFHRARGGRLRLPGDGTDYISLVHIADMASATVAALDVWPTRQELIVTDGEPAKWRDVFGYIARIVGSADPLPGGSLGLPSSRLRNERARDVLRWAPLYPDYRVGLVR